MAAVDTWSDVLVLVEDKWGGWVGKEAWRMVSAAAVDCCVSAPEVEDKHAMAALVVIFCGEEESSVGEMDMAVAAEMEVENVAASGDEQGSVVARCGRVEDGLAGSVVEGYGVALGGDGMGVPAVEGRGVFGGGYGGGSGTVG